MAKERAATAPSSAEAMCLLAIALLTPDDDGIYAGIVCPRINAGRAAGAVDIGTTRICGAQTTSSQISVFFDEDQKASRSLDLVVVSVVSCGFRCQKSWSGSTSRKRAVKAREPLHNRLAAGPMTKRGIVYGNIIRFSGLDSA